jgi:hypothetical protein
MPDDDPLFASRLRLARLGHQSSLAIDPDQWLPRPLQVRWLRGLRQLLRILGTMPLSLNIKEAAC